MNRRQAIASFFATFVLGLSGRRGGYDVDALGDRMWMAVDPTRRDRHGPLLIMADSCWLLTHQRGTDAYYTRQIATLAFHEAACKWVGA